MRPASNAATAAPGRQLGLHRDAARSMPDARGPEGATVILFLDFDGVLHSTYQPDDDPERVFNHVPLLATWLEARPGVDVVISSSWRLGHSQQDMVALLGPVIGSRVVGCTPWADQVRDDNVYPSSKINELAHERQVQIEAWMAASWDPGRAWVALDDMSYLFEAGCPRLVVCAGRQGLSSENIGELDRHAAQACLTRAAEPRPIALMPDRTQELGLEHFEKYVKHFGSCLPDAMFRVTLDRLRRLITIASDAFDSHLVGWLVTRLLPEDHGIRAYREDDAGWHPLPAPYELRLRIGGQAGVEFIAEVVRLSSAVGGGVTVRLSMPVHLMAGVE